MSYKKKILLINPETPVTYWSFDYILPYINKKTAFPPLGLITVAAMIPDNYELHLIDMNVSPLTDQDIMNADIIFTSSMIVQKKSLENIIARCNQLNKPVVAGGPYPTSSHEQIQGVDHFILGEAEETLPQFFADFEKDQLQKIYINSEKPDITQTPFPRFDLLAMDQYTTMSLQYSRGCPFNCEFCDIIEMFGRTPRTKSNDQFMRELDALYNQGHRGLLFIVDDNFIGNKNKAKKLLPEITTWQKAKKYPFVLYTEASVNLAQDEELMDLMVEAGFNKVFLGIETPVEESLILSQKQQNTRSNLLDSIHIIQRKGLEVAGGFILGFDNDPSNISELQVHFIQKSGIAQAMVGILTALPNTQLYRRLVKENRILTDTSGNNTHDLDINFIPTMGKEELIKGYKKVIETIYSPKHYFKRCLDLIQILPRGKVYQGAVTMSNLLMVVKIFLFSIYKLTFSKYGPSYLAYLAKTLFKNPFYFPKAIKMAFTGYHFFKITDDILEVENQHAAIEKLRSSVRKKINRLKLTTVENLVNELTTTYNDLATRMHKTYNNLNNELHKHLDEPLTILIEEFKLLMEKCANSLHEKYKHHASNKERAIAELRKFKTNVRIKIFNNERNIHDNLKIHTDELIEHLERIVDNAIKYYAKA